MNIDPPGFVSSRGPRQFCCSVSGIGLLGDHCVRVSQRQTIRRSYMHSRIPPSAGWPTLRFFSLHFQESGAALCAAKDAAPLLGVPRRKPRDKFRMRHPSERPRLENIPSIEIGKKPTRERPATALCPSRCSEGGYKNVCNSVFRFMRVTLLTQNKTDLRGHDRQLLPAFRWSCSSFPRL